MKEWQHGFELTFLKRMESFYEPHNRFALSPFASFKKNNIAEHLHKKTLHIVDGPCPTKDKELLQPFYPLAAYVVEPVKVSTKIKMFGNTVIGEKLKGDVVFSCLVGDSLALLDVLDPDGPYGAKNCWLFTFGGNSQIRQIAERSGFEYVGYKVTSFSEVIAIYFRNDPMNFGPREHPQISPAELVGMKKLFDVPQEHVDLYPSILHKLETLPFTNHYSNYNKKNAWSAISLRGYSPDFAFITKPAEMSEKWHKEHEDTPFALQDTALYKQFPEVRALLSFLDGDIHRVRFMKLAPGGGELLRHTDQVDPDAGNALGALARLHFPMKTNPQVLFTTWNDRDQPLQYHYGFGECWIIDTRKPHMAANRGSEERIHLVVDTVVTPKLERLITNKEN
jgi:hypothetical protein